MKINYKRTIRNFVSVLTIPLALYLVLLIARPTSMGGLQIFDIMRQAMLPAVLAWGVSFAFKLGLWHFAAGANVIAGIILGAGISERIGGGVIVTAALIVLTSVAIGFINGFLYIKIKVPSIIATIGSMLILESISALAWGGGGITVDGSFGEFFNTMPVVLISTVLIFTLAFILYTRTKYGFNLKAVSSNINVSQQQGINVEKVKLITFTIVGLFSGFYGVLTLARSNVQNPVTNMGSMDMVFNAVICFFLAAALEKYVSLIIGVYVGAVTVQLIRFGIVALGVSGQFNNAAVAIALIVFCALSSESQYMVNFRSKFVRIFVRNKKLSGNNQ